MTDFIVLLGCLLCLAICFGLMAKKRPIRLQIYKEGLPLDIDVGVISQVNICGMKLGKRKIEIISWKKGGSSTQITEISLSITEDNGERMIL